MFEEFENNTPFHLPTSIKSLREGLIGSNKRIQGPFGDRRLIYADYTASGRALDQVENWIRDRALPYYANSHTEISECGRRMNRLRRQARASIAASVHADETCEVIFCGSGATAAVNRLPHLFGLTETTHSFFRRKERPVVLIGPYEHHSNILPWRECGAQVVNIAEAAGGGVNMYDLEAALTTFCTQERLVIGAFSAASNVTGHLTDVAAVTRLLKSYGALSVLDYACAGAYERMHMSPAPDAPIDAIVFSPHKLPGGPGASGVLVIRKGAVRARRPTWPGGGSVSYVSDWSHDYLDDLVEREEAGTPNILGDLRAALTLSIRDDIGTTTIRRRGQRFLERAMKVWDGCEQLVILGDPGAPRLPIVSFLIRDPYGGIVHHSLVTRMLSDCFGIQAREGCSCAGPYGHKLLNVGRQQSERIRAQIRKGDSLAKPGWTRLNFCYLLDDETADYIIDTVAQLSETAHIIAAEYRADPVTGSFEHVGGPLPILITPPVSAHQTSGAA